MWSRARNRAAEKGLVFSLGIEDIDTPEFCPLLGIKLAFAKGKGPMDSSPALDRIVPSGGYTKENTWVISHRANTMKSNGSLHELKTLVENLEKKINEFNGGISQNESRPQTSRTSVV